MAPTRQFSGRIFAMGGGGFSMEPDNPTLDDHLLAPLSPDERATLRELLLKVTAELPEPTR